MADSFPFVFDSDASPPEAAPILARLAADDAAVRRHAATNPAIPPARLIGLLSSADPPLATGAAANRALPVEAMQQVLDKAGL